MRDLTGGNLIFRTLPIKGYATIGGQDSNLVDPAYIKAIVQAAFYPKPGSHHRHHRPEARAARTTTVDVRNGGDTTGLAARVSAALTRAGYRAGQVGDTNYRATTAVLHGAGASANAGRIDRK